ncbi:hypothetical protein KUTeg_022738 [Tegillarca granosa]|uniref:Uncharacterized protein n=1 Tax=Tegillarca granosa TaxID=220873 RepID=A0ABQ9E5W7_TEGGR|nr:hypothetical protein KUTeg_022738 [Tegillarca granosa]
MNTRIFGRVLIFCVALAAGTLGATGLLVLIPESMHLTTEDSPVPDYHWKLTTALGGIYMFFVIERIIRVIVHNKNKPMQQEISIQENSGEKKEFIEQNNGHSHYQGVDKDGKKTVAPVAWILLIGDALHNFVDGLSIGAAFTENIFTGISVSLAIICEELPHELGDIAVLLHSGFTMKRALLCNFLAAVVCFVGLVIGVLVGDTTDGNQWIFGIAGGLFIYIALADMFPEMSQQANLAEKGGSDSPGVVFVYQNAGLLCGFLIIEMLVNFGGNIQV